MCRKRSQLAVHLVIYGKTSSVVDNGKVAFYHFAVQIRIFPAVSGVLFPNRHVEALSSVSVVASRSLTGLLAWRLLARFASACTSTTRLLDDVLLFVNNGLRCAVRRSKFIE